MSRVGSAKSRAKTKQKIAQANTPSAKRKAGWKEAAQGIKDVYTQDVRGTQIGTALKEGAKLRSKNPGATGSFLAGSIPGLVKGSIKAIHGVLKHEAQIAKGVFKGIFNHPDWYKYKGELSIPAHNIIRPFTPTTLRAIQSNYESTRISGAGAGVTHVVHVNISFQDVRATEAYQLACIEAFRAIRLDLKSNLPYKQESYNNFVAQACSVYIKAKMIEKLLGNYNVTRGDIPEYTRATQTVPFNYLENGVITPTQIQMLSDTNYATTLNNFKKLKSIIGNIAIPKKLAEYLSWWVGSQFIDQSAPNPQIYTTMLRDSVTYNSTDIDTMNVQYSWDIATGSVQDVIDEALNLLNVYGILNADIIKTGRYGMCDLVMPENYSTIYLNDPEFFSILINSYTEEAGTTPNSLLYKKDYVRVDALDDVTEVNLVGMCNALSKWAAYPVLCRIESEACYLQVDDKDDLPSGGTSSILQNAAGYNIYATESNGAFIQVSSFQSDVREASVTATSGSQTFGASANVRFSESNNSSVSSLSATLGAMSTTISRITPAAILVSWFNASNQQLALQIARGDTAIKIYNYTTGSVAATLSFTGTITWADNTVTITAGTAAIASTYVAMVNPAALWESPFVPYLTVTVTYAVTNTVSAVVTLPNISICTWFTQLVDYHVPIIFREWLNVKYNGNQVGVAKRPPELLKECYKPMIFNYADISTVLYWMYLGLFSME